MDDGGRPHLLALLAAVGSESVLWSGPGGRVARNTLPEPTWHLPLRTVEYNRPPPRGKKKDLPYLLYNHRGGTRFTTWGIPRVGDDADGAMLALHALSCLGLYDNCGVGQPPHQWCP